jgi:methyl-accepting chemotaxis protein
MLVTLVALWFYFRRAVLVPMQAAVGFAGRIAGGDLTSRIETASQDEAGQLLRSLEKMQAELGSVVWQVRASADAVATASAQVADGTTDLSQRTEEQASSLEETAASMEELASTVRQNAENAQHADTLARGASQRAEQGGSEIVHMVTTMGDITDSAKRIGDIISVIDGIAFQTNILAARAGEQGRGFAVVASEVRALAQRSADAAREIKGLIGHSLEKVRAGTHIAEQAGDTIQALVIDVKRVSDLMRSIAEASAEQSRGVQQVNKTVTEMDKVVQHNASAVQQSAAAAQAMRQHAQTLVETVSAFQLNQEFAPAAPARVSAPRPSVTLSAAGSKARALPPTPALAAAQDEWEQF